MYIARGSQQDSVTFVHPDLSKQRRALIACGRSRDLNLQCAMLEDHFADFFNVLLPERKKQE